MASTPPVEIVYQRPATFTDATTHYCPGCTHGVAHRLVAEVLEEMEIQDRYWRSNKLTRNWSRWYNLLWFK